MTYLCYEDLTESKGGALHVINVITQLCRLGHQVRLIIPAIYARPDLPGIEVIRIPSVRVRVLNWMGFYLLSTLYVAVTELFSKSDVLYAREMVYNLALSAMAVVLRRPLILEINGLSVVEAEMAGAGAFERAMIAGYQRFACRHASALITVAPGIKDGLVQAYGLRPDAVTVVPNGTDPEMFVPLDSEECRARLGLPSGVPMIGYVGNCNPYHDLTSLITAAPAILREYPDAQFVIVGDGFMRPRWMEAVERAGLVRSFHFPGRVAYQLVPSYINAFTVGVVLITSVRNLTISLSSPLKLYDYLACGRPAVGTDIAGVGDLLTGAQTGLALPPEDPSALATALLTLLRDDDLRATIGRNGRRVVLEQYTWQRVAEQVADICQRTITGRPSFHHKERNEEIRGSGSGVRGSGKSASTGIPCLPRSIVWVNDFPPVTSGIATFFVNICQRLPPDRVAVLAPRLPGAAEIDRALPFPVRRVWIPLGESAAAKGIKTLITILRTLLLCVTERPARFHCGQVFSSGIAGLLGKKLCGIPYVVYVYGSETIRLGQRSLSRRLMHAVLRESEWVVANSRFTASEFDAFGVDGRRLRVIYPGVDTDRFRPGEPDRELIDRFQLDGKSVLLTVARLDERKGHDTVLRALAALGAEGERLAYLIVGKGREEARLRRLADDLGLHDRVIFAGYVPDADLPRYYTLCAVFVMPNRTTTQTALAGDIEGFGISFIEASACGKPVIAGRSGGASEAVVDEETGLLVDPESPDAVAAALLRVLRDPDLARRLGEAGRRRVEAEYDWRRLAKRVEEIL